jgi:predicted MPP superfamily phosphohydrolase
VGITRRELLRGAAIAGAAAALPAAARAGELAAERVDLVLPGLRPEHEGLRVAQLSDIHLGPNVPAGRIAAALAEVVRFAPDLVLLTGDFVSYDGREVGLVRELLGGLAAPTFAVLGNHDHWVDAAGVSAALRGHGYELLENAWTRIAVRGAPLAVVGVGDAVTGKDDVERSLRGLSAPAALVLAHSPRTADALRRTGRSLLCFAGHTHGGQIYVPLATPIYFLAAMGERYLRGEFELGRVRLYVNRGIGSARGRRWLAPPEVTLATVRGGGHAGQGPSESAPPLVAQ